jgi:hypothetical protein
MLGNVTAPSLSTISYLSPRKLHLPPVDGSKTSFITFSALVTQPPMVSMLGNVTAPSLSNIRCLSPRKLHLPPVDDSKTSFTQPLMVSSWWLMLLLHLSTLWDTNPLQNVQLLMCISRPCIIYSKPPFTSSLADNAPIAVVAYHSLAGKLMYRKYQETYLIGWLTAVLNRHQTRLPSEMQLLYILHIMHSMFVQSQGSNHTMWPSNNTLCGIWHQSESDHASIDPKLYWIMPKFDLSRYEVQTCSQIHHPFEYRSSHIWATHSRYQ